MCGIAGFCNRGKDWQNSINIMNEKMYHRGPDAVGVWSSDDCAVVLGHRRLSIVDLTPTGAQPMISHNNRYVIAYNGEIYNYITIKQKMEKEGHATAFRGTSDTEVLLEAVSAYGIVETLRICKGMFAIALYDKEEQTLYLARDRVGEKPLYYGYVNCNEKNVLKHDLADNNRDRIGKKDGNVGENNRNANNNNCFVFASDLNSISALEGFQNDINTGVLENYFRYGYISAPNTIYRNIFKLEPGKILKIKAPFNKYEIIPYWSMVETAVHGQQNPFKGNAQEASEELERLLKESIKGQMMADVPVGAFLSAGIDSSTVVSLMQEVSPTKVKSFTIGMWDEKYNEAEIAKQIAGHLGTEHTELYITEEDAKAVIPMLPDMFGEPFADSSQIPTYLVSRMTREHVTVSLSGDGGDELFCGYNTYNSVKRIWDKTNRIPGVLRKPVSSIMTSVMANQYGPLLTKSRLLGAESIEDMYLRSEIGEGFRIVRRECLDKSGECLTVMDRYERGLLSVPEHNLMLMDLCMYHPDDILNKVDRCAMAVSLETRVPMLDRDVVEFAWTLPLALRKENGVAKKILKDVLYKHVPRELMERPKKGFSIPLHKWLKEPKLREWAESLIAKDYLDNQGILNTDVVWRLWNDYTEKDIWRPQIWYILMFEQWMMNRTK